LGLRFVFWQQANFENGQFGNGFWLVFRASALLASVLVGASKLIIFFGLRSLVSSFGYLVRVLVMRLAVRVLLGLMIRLFFAFFG
jgi:hypothetical protein